MKKLLANSRFQALLSQGIPAFTGLLSFALIARGLGVEELGHWFIFLAAVNMAEMLKVGFLKSALLQAIGESPERTKYWMKASWMLALGLSILLAIVSGFWVPLFVPAGADSWLWFAKVYPLLGLFSLPFHYATFHFQAQRQFQKITLLRMVQAGLWLGFIATLFFQGAASLPLLVWGYTFLFALLSLFSLSVTKKHLSLPWGAAKADLLRLFHFGKFSLGTVLGSNLLKSSDVFLIGAWLGPAAVAVYGIPLKIMELLELPARAFSFHAVPTLNRLAFTNRKEFWRSFKKQTAALSLLFLLLSFVVFALAGILVRALGASDIATASALVRILVLYGLLLAWDRMSGVVFDALRRPQWNLVKVLAMAALNIAADIFVLEIGWGLEAVALVTLANITLGSILSLFFLKRAGFTATFQGLMASFTRRSKAVFSGKVFAK